MLLSRQAEARYRAMTFPEALVAAAAALVPSVAAVAPAPAPMATASALAPGAASSTIAATHVACELRPYRAPGLHRGGRGRRGSGRGSGRGSSLNPRSLGYGGSSATTPQTGFGMAPSTSRDTGSASGDIGLAAGLPVPFPGFAPATSAVYDSFEAQMDTTLAANPANQGHRGLLPPRHGKAGVHPHRSDAGCPPRHGKRKRNDDDETP